jgi:acetyl-CoA C-acetyltransferase/acetyl-CoA acyltransferase
MKTLRKKVYITAGYNTTFFGPGRKEFHPKKPMPPFETYLKEAIEGASAQVQNPDFDEGVMTNFIASRFIRQAHLAAFLPHFAPSLRHKPCTRVEGACGTGGFGVVTAVKSVLSDMADAVLVAGFEIQNSMKAVYGADVLAGAGYYGKDRKNGHAYYFPCLFSDRAGAYARKFDKDLARQGMAKWYEISIKNARRNPKAQEYHNAAEDPFALGMTPPNPKAFLEHLNYYDCSKVTDGASALVVLSEEGLAKTGVKKKDCVEVAGFAQSEDDIARPPDDPGFLSTTADAARKAMDMAGIQNSDVGLLELHDCFTITALIALEFMGFADRGRAGQFLLDGKTTVKGELPVNPSGGLCGFGHPVGATGVRQAVDLLHQFTGKADNPADIRKDYGMMVNMGGNDKSLASVVVRRAG